TFTAEVSLYKSTRLYRGHSGRTRLDTASNVVPADTACEKSCGVADAICLVVCAATSGPFFPLCAGACEAGTVACLLGCQVGGGVRSRDVAHRANHAVAVAIVLAAFARVFACPPAQRAHLPRRRLPWVARSVKSAANATRRVTVLCAFLITRSVHNAAVERND